MGLSVVLIEQHDLGQIVGGTKKAGIAGDPPHQCGGLIVDPATDQGLSQKGVDLSGYDRMTIIMVLGPVAEGMAAQGPVERLLEIGLVIHTGKLFDQAGENQKGQAGIAVFFLRSDFATVDGTVDLALEIVLYIEVPVESFGEPFVGLGPDKVSFGLSIAYNLLLKGDIGDQPGLVAEDLP